MITKTNGANLYVKNKDGWASLSDWAYFYINVGKVFYDNLPTKAKARLVLTLPTRSYAGVCIAYGAILSSISDKVDDETINEHFQKIKGMEIGTSVIYRKQSRTYRGIYSGIEMVEGEERIRITIQEKKAGNLTEILNRKQSLSVQIATDKNFRLPKNPIGRENRVSNFLKTGFKDYNYNRLLTLSQPQFYYIGRKKWVKDEAIDTEIAVYDSKKNEYIQGNLNELLRMKEFMGEQDSYQSHLLSSSAASHKFDLINFSPSTFTIFDGAISYLRWRERFKYTHSIIILDRTDTQFESALFELNDEYILSQKMDKDFPMDIRLIPKGVEMMFWEAY
ncbi:hypothetical protein PB1_12204 [Bacillus methanolicus PB1]|uniref:Uncharacterized protein n=1 Tax=Bacillus methanolicus PB1 TaxID=997296 RepID=I3DVQ2_BACMT|nr:hypothetical protein [Bacillus methanolicus]EIJ78323.1 hypothetical protein PB1_12204 [Bacillus methanolicus PB1]